MLEFLRLRIFLLMNLNCNPFYLIQKEMLVFSFSITYVCFLIFVRTMFVSALVFYLSKLLFKDNICKNNYFYFILL